MIAAIWAAYLGTSKCNKSSSTVSIVYLVSSLTASGIDLVNHSVRGSGSRGPAQAVGSQLNRVGYDKNVVTIIMKKR
jgi:hypothetical protein